MKTILCYGDSNTWGHIPGTGLRYGCNERWPGVLRTALGNEFQVIEEGLNSRTTCMDDPTRGPGRNGLTYLGPCLDSHAPLDLVLLMLGTNDLKHRFGLSAYDIASNVAVLLETIRRRDCHVSGAAPLALLIAPPHLGALSAKADVFAGGVEKSKQLAEHYRVVATQAGCAFLDAAEIVTASPIDGVHWAREQHVALGLRLADLVRSM